MNTELDELNDLLSSFEERAIEEENKKLSKLLVKRGIKIREYQWTELEAS